jgi:hypothetical protein
VTSKSLGQLPADSTVILYCSPTKFEKIDGKYVAPSIDAFRKDPDGISVTWVEFFRPPPPSTDQAKAAMATNLTINKNAVFAVAKVGQILDLAMKENLAVTVDHDPIEGNSGHTLIKGWPHDADKRDILTRAFPPPPLTA